MYCAALFCSVLFDTSLSCSVFFHSFSSCSLLITLLRYLQWLEFMATPLLQLVDNHEELELSDGINVFEMPPLGTGFTEEVRGSYST